MKKIVHVLSIITLLFAVAFVLLTQEQIVLASENKVTKIPQPKVNPQAEVQFKDSNLDKLMKEKYGDGKRVTENDLAKVTNLSLRDVQSLEGLEKAHKMVNLSIEDSSIEDFTPIENLWQLTHLKLQNTNLKSMSQLENIGKTVRQGVYHHELYLINNDELEDLDTIQAWETLNILSLKGNKIKDLQPLLELPRLGVLYLDENHLNQNSKEVLRELKRRGVYIDSNIELHSKDDIFFKSKVLEEEIRKALKLPANSPISENHLLKLEELDVSNKNVESLDGLQYARNLKKLNISGTQVGELSPIEELEKLEVLLAASTPYFILDLESYPNLTKLDISDKSYFLMHGMEKSNVRDLKMAKTKTYELPRIAKMPYLENLDLTGAYYNEQEWLEIEKIKNKGINVKATPVGVLPEKDVKIYIDYNYPEPIALTQIDSVKLESLKALNWAGVSEQRFENVKVYQDEKGSYIKIPNLKLAEDYYVVMVVEGNSSFDHLSILSDEVTFTLATKKKIIGKLIDIDGNPMVNQKITFADSADQHKYVYTDEKGNFEYWLKYEDALDIRIEGTFYDLPLKRLTHIKDDSNALIDLGTFQLTEEYEVFRIVGRAVNEEGKGVHNFKVQAKALNHHYVKTISSWGQDGYFTFTDLLEDDYKLTIFDSTEYRMKELYVTPSEDLKTITLSEKLSGVFQGGNNRIKVSKHDVAQGETVQYQIEYENTSNEVISDVLIRFSGFLPLDIVQDSYRLNDKPIKPEFQNRVRVGDLQPGETGVLTFEAINIELEVGQTKETLALIDSQDAETAELALEIYNTGSTGNMYAKDHVFQIYLNEDFDLKEAERYVEVRDAKNDKVAITLQKVNQSLMVRPSNGEYEPGQYSIIVHEDFKNKSGVKLSEAVNFTFTIKQ